MCPCSSQPEHRDGLRCSKVDLSTSQICQCEERLQRESSETSEHENKKPCLQIKKILSCIKIIIYHMLHNILGTFLEGFSRFLYTRAHIRQLCILLNKQWFSSGQSNLQLNRTVADQNPSVCSSAVIRPVHHVALLSRQRVCWGGRRQAEGSAPHRPVLPLFLFVCVR